jgi:hypothetical protein
MDVQKCGTVVPISDARIAMEAEINAAMRRWSEATPEQRAEWEREAAEKRAECRRTHSLLSESDADIINGIAEHFATYGEFWTPAYVRHLAQPYCECSWDQDGCWDLCQHAIDLGFRG